MKKILLIAGDFTEDYELIVPFQSLKSMGFDVDVVCPFKKKGDKIKTAIHDFEGDLTYTEKPGHYFVLNANFDEVKKEEYAGLYLPGGRSPEYQRLVPKVIDIICYFMEVSKPVASICHGAQFLTAANVLKGRRLTAYPAIEPDINMAGGIYVAMNPDEAMIDGNLVSSPAWPGNPAIIREFVKLLGGTVII